MKEDKRAGIFPEGICFELPELYAVKVARTVLKGESGGNAADLLNQMIWSPEFKQRVLFNASKAYVRQLNIGEHYELLQPVYSLNLVNEVFEPSLKGYYHYYRMVHEEHSDKVINGLHLVFVELPKFVPHTYKEKKMHILWLRYLTEINEKTRKVPEELLANPEIKKAVTALEESAFTDAQLLGYEKFWDIISAEKTLYYSGVREGKQEGIEEGIEIGMEKGKQEGIEIGIEKGKQEEQLAVASKMKKENMPIALIAKITGLTEEEIEAV